MNPKMIMLFIGCFIIWTITEGQYITAVGHAACAVLGYAAGYFQNDILEKAEAAHAAIKRSIGKGT